uniref:Transmembrane and TPR repeat-containing protein 3 n=1 Tax=Heterorhabditis bacteriophora TaxID=37862 RepID=A0A1I7WC46_HETBA
MPAKTSKKLPIRRKEIVNSYLSLPPCYYIFVFLSAVLVFCNIYDADFVYDDSEAIVNNEDVTGKTPLLEIFKNDFWGNPISNPGSHKSYRPLTTITFRLNRIIFGLKPMSNKGPFRQTERLQYGGSQG